MQGAKNLAGQVAQKAAVPAALSGAIVAGAADANAQENSGNIPGRSDQPWHVEAGQLVSDGKSGEDAFYANGMFTFPKEAGPVGVSINFDAIYNTSLGETEFGSDLDQFSNARLLVGAPISLFSEPGNNYGLSLEPLIGVAHNSLGVGFGNLPTNIDELLAGARVRGNNGLWGISGLAGINGNPDKPDHFLLEGYAIIPHNDFKARFSGYFDTNGSDTNSGLRAGVEHLWRNGNTQLPELTAGLFLDWYNMDNELFEAQGADLGLKATYQVPGSGVALTLTGAHRFPNGLDGASNYVALTFTVNFGGENNAAADYGPPVYGRTSRNANAQLTGEDNVGGGDDFKNPGF